MNNLSSYSGWKRIWISILLGILCFILSPYSFKVVFDQITINIPWSMIFPLFASLSFGWEYGFISGITGGAFFPFLIWANDGWANLFTSLLYLGIYTLVGLANKFNIFPRFNNLRIRFVLIFLISIIAIASYSLLLINPILSLNPPFWNINTIKHLSSNALLGIALKDCINLVSLVLITECLIMLPFVRKVLGISVEREMRHNSKIFIFTVLTFFIIWIIFVGLGLTLLKESKALQYEHVALACIVIIASGILTSRVLIYYNMQHLIIRLKLNQSEQKYKALFDYSNDAILILKEGTFVECNEKALELFRCSLNDILGKTLEDFSPLIQQDGTSSGNVLFERLNSAFKGIPQRFEWTYSNYTGELSEAEVSINRLCVSNEVFLQLNLQDISERKKSEKLIRENELRIRTIFNQSIGFVGLLTPDGKVLEANNSSLEFAGIKGSDVYGKYLWETPWWIHSEEMQSLLKKAIAVAAKGNIFRSEVTLRSKDDVLHTIDFSLKPVIDDEGRIIQLVPEGRDITESKQAEKVIFESKALTTSIINSTSDLIWSCDSERFSLTTFNDAFSQQFLKTRGIIVKTGLLPEELLPLEYSLKWRSYYHKALTEGSYQTEYLTHDGRLVLELNLNVLKREGVIYGISVFGKDMTDRKHAENILKLSEERYRSLFERVPIGLYRISLDGQILDFNPAAVKMLGFQNAQGMLMHSNPDSRVRSIVRKQLIEQIEQSGIFDGEVQMQTINNEVIWVQNKALAIRDDNGAIKYIEGSLEDITKRKQAEDALRENEEKIRAVFESSRDAIGVSKNGEHIFANPAYLKLFGFKSNEQIYKTSILESIAPSHRSQMINNIEKRAKNVMVPAFYESRGVRTNGAEFDAEFSVATYKLEDEIYSVATIRDITERKKAEEELRKLFHVIEQSPVSLIITDYEGNIEYINPFFTKLTGFTLEDVKGKTPRILKSGYTSLSEYKEIWGMISNGREWQGELYNKKKNGEYYWEAVSISPVINNQGMITNYIAVKEDITEKKEADRKIMQAIIDAEENERKRFSQELHDGLGPIMSAVKLYFHLLAVNKEPKQKSNLMEKGTQSIDEAIQLIREISNNLSPRVLNNYGVVNAIRNFINLLNETKRIFVEFSYNTERRFGTNLEITLYRITTELINNALKYSGATQAEIKLKYVESSSILILEYMDAGKGFDLQEVMNLRKGHGLMNIHQRISSMNGKIAINTTLGKGVQINIQLPVDDGNS